MKWCLERRTLVIRGDYWARTDNNKSTRLLVGESAGCPMGGGGKGRTETYQYTDFQK
jgi:hypothetical protein